jgi:hypothetical protein
MRLTRIRLGSGSASWAGIAPIPITMWGAGSSAADGELLLSGGVTNANGTFTNQGYAYDPGSGSWTALPNANDAYYRGGSACGFYRIGGTPVFFDGQDAVEQLPGCGTCGGTTVPWLSESQDSFTLIPGQQVTVTVTLNAGSASVTLPGDYTAALLVTDSTPYPASPVPVTLTATAPATWGEIIGHVSGAGCSGSAEPLPGATVQVDGPTADYTLITNSDGNYDLWLDSADSPVTLIASATGWQTAFSGVAVTAGQATTTNITLQPSTACA